MITTLSERSGTNQDKNDNDQHVGFVLFLFLLFRLGIFLVVHGQLEPMPTKSFPPFKDDCRLVTFPLHLSLSLSHTHTHARTHTQPFILFPFSFSPFNAISRQAHVYFTTSITTIHRHIQVGDNGIPATSHSVVW